MKNRPLPVIIVSILFIIAGGVGFVYHLKEFSGPNAKLYELLWTELVRLIAVVCGLLLLMSINWARWLAIAWLLFHVIISAFHSTTEMILHIVFLLLVTVLLYLPQTSAYFQKKNKQ
jgi:Trk-type K+ transport system membrane component